MKISKFRPGVDAIADGTVYELRSGRYRVTQLAEDRVRFIHENVTGRKMAGTLPANAFSQMLDSGDASILQLSVLDELRERWPRLACRLREALLGGVIYCIIAGLFWLRGLEWWWYWPLWLGWTTLWDALTN